MTGHGKLKELTQELLDLFEDCVRKIWVILVHLQHIAHELLSD